MSRQLLGKVSLITGASSGIGQGAAIELASRGSRVALVGRNEGNLKITRDKCLATGLEAGDVLIIKADLTKEDEAKKTIDETVKHFNQLDVLVNAAGIIATGTTETTSLDSFDSMMLGNVRSVFHLMQMAIPHLKVTKGNIVNVSSVNGLRAFPGVVAYCMSKAALDQLTRCTALELATDGVRVNSINPGVIVTNLHQRGGMDDATYTAFLERSKTTHAMGRVGSVDETSKAIAFLASDDSSFSTGLTLSVDGGRNLMCPR